MEGADSQRFNAGNKAVWITKKICGKCIAKSSDRTAPGDGGKRACPPRGLRRSTAESGVFADGTGQKPEAHSGFHAGLG